MPIDTKLSGSTSKNPESKGGSLKLTLPTPEELQRRASAGDSLQKQQKRAARRLSTPSASLGKVHEDFEEDMEKQALEFLIQRHQQYQLMNLQDNNDNNYVYLACLGVGLCVGSLFALLLKVMIVLSKYMFLLLVDI